MRQWLRKSVSIQQSKQLPIYFLIIYLRKILEACKSLKLIIFLSTVSAQIRGWQLIKKLGFYGEDFTKGQVIYN